MRLLGIDLGGTKLAAAIFDEEGTTYHKEIITLANHPGMDAGQLVNAALDQLLSGCGHGRIDAVGIAVPGIFHHQAGTVWAPNIPRWEAYPLLQEAKKICGNVAVTIDSDRACYILGETWQGNAKQHKHAIYLAVGTGIGAGIMIEGHVLRGSRDIAGAIGWLALSKPFDPKYIRCGCFESYASGEGIAERARQLVKAKGVVAGPLSLKSAEQLTAHDVFDAHRQNDPIAAEIIRECIEFWGMAAANLVSLFNPEKIIFGGGVFGPAVSLIPMIESEASKWAQPISMKQVAFTASALAGDAGVYGAARLALNSIT